MGKKMNMKFIELNSIGTLQGDNRTGNDTLLELYVFDFLYKRTKTISDDL